MSGSSQKRKKNNKEQPFCGFTVKPKYPVNTRLKKHFPGHGDFEGRVTGFDGEFYDILYEDGDSEVFDVSGFDSVEILAPLKTAGTRNGMQHTNNDNNANNPDVVVKKPKHEIPTCPICTEEFTCDTANRESGRLPIQAIHCPHVICKECVTKIHLTFLQGDSNRRKFVDCPICKRSKSFNVQEFTVCLTMCEMVELCQTINKQQQDLSTMDVATEIRRRRMLRAAEERYESAKRQRVGAPEAVVSSSGKVATSAVAEPDPAPSSMHAQNNYAPSVLICTGCRMARKLKNFPKDQVKKGVKDHRADVYCQDCLVRCSNCQVNKPKDKYSSKQLRTRSESASVCRRCVDKATIRKRFGQKLQNITIHIQKWNSSLKRNLKSHVATAIQWPVIPMVDSDHQQKHNTELPDDLTLDGYSRETWALLENNPEGVWSTVSLIFLGNKAAGFLKFLKDNKKSAYATFKLASGQDGFFVIPYDQPPIGVDNGALDDVVLHCKYVIGLGLDLDSCPRSGKESTNEIQSYSDTEGETQTIEDYMTSSKLSNLLSKVHKTNQAISSMPQAVARQYIQKQNALARPDVPLSRPGSGDWYRPCTMTIRNMMMKLKRISLSCSSFWNISLDCGGNRSQSLVMALAQTYWSLQSLVAEKSPIPSKLPN